MNSRKTAHWGVVFRFPKILMQSSEAKQQEFEDDWITLREAMKLMHVNELYLRQKDGRGNYVHFPELARIQWRDGAKIFFLRSQILEWRKQMERAALEQCQPAAGEVEEGTQTYAPIRDELARLTTDPKLFRALGIEKPKKAARSQGRAR